jgi:DNA gyrase subunit A
MTEKEIFYISIFVDIGKVEKREITEELKDSYLDYAMSVIISRALPDVRDGMKPVHRRILYAMWDTGVGAHAKLRKSAYVVGEVLGKYHPHGDVAVYDSLARMAQDFSLRYPMIQGQGNFGSIDGDSPAAMRYTECRLNSLAEEMLLDIDKETVDWVDNYDGTRKEPTVLPAKLPQLLINGSVGIAVGMATNIPPHNLTEVIDAAIHLINDPDATSEELCQFVKGPDFPTGGYIYDQKTITAAYSQGKGSIVNRAKTEIIETKKGQFQIVVTEIPYQVNKSVLLERVAELVKDKKIEGIKDIRDESDKEGLRIVVDVKADASSQKILNQLFKLTDLQKTFHMNILALSDGVQPQILSLKNLLEQYLTHRYHIVTRRTKFDLQKAKERAHILEGLKIALDHIDAIISTIRKSESKDNAKENLMKKFKLSEVQAMAILSMPLSSLAKLERFKIEDELKEKKRVIKELEEILKSPKKVQKVIEGELLEVKNKYGDERRTKVFKSPVGEFSEEDLVPEEESIITLTEDGYIKRMNPKTYRAQHRGGKGVTGMTTREEDDVRYFISASTHDSILFFTNTGRIFQSKAYEIPVGSRTARGQAIVNILQLTPQEKVTAMLPLKKGKEKKEGFLVMTTVFGIIKKTMIEDFENVRRSGLVAIKLQDSDQLGWARLSSGKDEIMLSSQAGQVIRFKEKDIRPMGRAAAGIRGMRLKKGDALVGMDIIKDTNSKVLIVAENGYGKITDLKHFKVQKRGGSGIKIAKVTPKTGKIVAVQVLSKENEDLIAISSKGQVIRTPLKSIPNLGRATQGVRVMKVEAGDKVASITCV